MNEHFVKDCAFINCYILPRGGYELTVGRQPGSDILILDEHISARHLIIKSNADNSDLFITVDGRNGARINGQFYGKNENIGASYGTVIEILCFWICIGRFHCFISRSDSIRTALCRIEVISTKRLANTGSENRASFVPSVRCAPTYNLEPIELDSPPARKNPEKQPIMLAAGPALTMAVPILLGSGRKIMIIAGVISAIWATANVVSRRKKTINEEKRRRKAYSEYVEGCEAGIQDRLKEIKNTMTAAYPELSEFLKGGGNIHLMWNRLKDESDFFYIRCGIGEREFPVEIKYQREKFSVTEDSLKSFPAMVKRKYSTMKDVPICIDLRMERLYAISTKGVKKCREMALSLALNLAVSVRFEDIKIAFICDNRFGLESFSFVPHAWSGINPLIAMGDNISEVISHIKAISDDIVLFTDRVDVFDEFMVNANVRLFFLTESFDLIPPSVDCILYSDQSFSGLIRNDGISQNRIPVIFDRMSLKKFDTYSRLIGSLSSHIYDVKRAIPDRILLMDLFENEIDEEYICQMHQVNDATYSLKVPIGMGGDGKLIYLDLDERGDGPHGLIAGTTGSGKSELLQTLILSLAISYSPQDVTFFLIDYKGGGMANMFSDLPHLSGSISNLSGAVIERAMVSIKSEIRYRQEQFSVMNVNNIRDYRKQAKMPHIVIIIDEFAELKKEEPEFMTQLVSVAQVGRSLGVHLILSTQKPSGVVDDKIWSNSRFRICLKVRDKTDSNDMLHRPDAAYITNVGRAYLQVGNDEIFEEFQCGYTSAPADGKNIDSGIRIYDSFLRRIPVKMQENVESENKEQKLFLTQVELLKLLLSKAYDLEGHKAIRKLWLPELEPLIVPDERPENHRRLIGENNLDGNEIEVIVGVYDDPINQARGNYCIDINQCGNVAIIGSSGSGKSTMIMRILCEMLENADTKDVQFYIIDFGGKRLEIFEKSRMCGGYVGIDNYERTLKLLHFVDEQIKLRQRKKSGARPHLLIIVDNYAAMLEYAGQDVEMRFVEMLRNCRSQNITFIVSAGGMGNGELSTRAATLMDTVIPICLKDRYSYAVALNTTASKIPAVDMLPGRGVAKIGKRILAFQGYIPVAVCEENMWEDKISNAIKLMNQYYSSDARGYPYVPDNATVKNLCDSIKQFEENAFEGDAFEKNCLPIGYVEDTGKIYSLPLDAFGIMLIAGRTRSGRKNTLKVISYMSDQYDIPVYCVSSLREISKLIQNNNEGLVLIDNLGATLEQFYKSDFDPKTEEIICSYVEAAEITPYAAKLKIIAVISNKDRVNLLGKRLFQVLIEHPYGLCMGGGLDEVNMFDFSYIGYSAMQKRHRAGYGSVAIYEEDVFYGNVTIPLCKEDDTC